MRDNLYRLIGREISTDEEEEEESSTAISEDSPPNLEQDGDTSGNGTLPAMEEDKEPPLLPLVRVRMHPYDAELLLRTVTAAEGQAWMGGYALPGQRWRLLLIDH